MRRTLETYDNHVIVGAHALGTGTTLERPHINVWIHYLPGSSMLRAMFLQERTVQIGHLRALITRTMRDQEHFLPDRLA